MSDASGDIEVEAVSGYEVLPKDVTSEIGSIKLFNKWYATTTTPKCRRAVLIKTTGLTKMLRSVISL
jgi:hypothetical protein